MNILYESSKDPMMHLQQKEYEAIDTLLCAMMHNVELSCRKLCTGITPLSPTYSRVMTTLEYWKMRKSYLSGKHSTVRQLIVLQNKLKIEYNKNMSLEEVIKKLRETSK